MAHSCALGWLRTRRTSAVQLSRRFAACVMIFAAIGCSTMLARIVRAQATANRPSEAELFGSSRSGADAGPQPTTAGASQPDAAERAGGGPDNRDTGSGQDAAAHTEAGSSSSRPSEAELFGADHGSQNAAGANEAAAASRRPSEAELFGADHGSQNAAGANEAAAASRRPSEAELFGGAGAEPATGDGSASAGSGSTASQPAAPLADARDAVLAGDRRPMFTEEPAPFDPLTIGGQIYLRLQSTANEHTEPKHWGISSPTLLDVFFDARPNDRVRGFVRGRMSYDPLLPAAQSGLSSTTLLSNTGTAGSTSVSPLYTGASGSPRVLLDQLWLRFDIAHQLFVTVGKQHDRWGTGRFWTPADYLHQRRRNPLDVFDVRTGTTMVKMHLPVESLNWNFYGYGVLENDGGRPNLRTPAGALRAEFVVGAAELGLGAYGSARSRARFAADLSFGLGDIDFYGELALRDAREIDRVRYVPDAMVPMGMMPTGTDLSGVPAEVIQALALAQLQQEVDAIYPAYRERGYRPQLVAGLSYARKYNDNDIFTVGLEYFYNSLGYADPNAYSGLLWPHSQPLSNPASFFYLGRHYAAVFISFPAPFKLDLHTFTLSTLGNLSDRSFTTRFDYALTLLTHLRFEAYASVSYGDRGEFRFQIASLPSIPLESLGFPHPTIFALGLGLRLMI